MSRFTQGLAVITVAIATTSHGFAAPKQAPLTSAVVQKQLRNLPNPELPAQTAKLVVAAQGETREAQTEMIVTTSVRLNPVAAPMIVSSVCRLSPDVAATAAAAAAKIEPQQMEAIVRAATTAAPGQALNILTALCKDHGKQYETIATSVSKAVQGMDRSIVTTVGEAIPSLKLFIGRSLETLTKQKDFVMSVPAVFSQVTADVDNTSRVLKTSQEVLLTKGVPQAQFSMLPPPPLPQPRKLVAFQPYDDSVNQFPTKYFDSVPVTGGRNYSTPAN